MDAGRITIQSAPPYWPYGSEFDVVIDQAAVNVQRVAVLRNSSVTHSTDIGLTEAQRDRLFKPFDRLGREHSAVAGSGLGLHLSQQLAQRMGGFIRAASEAGRGSTFELRLRRAPDAVATAPLPLPGSRTLLAFEDDAVAIELLSALAARRRDWQLVHRGVFADGLALIRLLRPDVVLLDLHLPDGNGQTLLDAIRADPQLRSVRVVIVSAGVLVPGGVADAVAPEPWDLTELERTIDAVLP